MNFFKNNNIKFLFLDKIKNKSLKKNNKFIKFILFFHLNIKKIKLNKKKK